MDRYGGATVVPVDPMSKGFMVRNLESIRRATALGLVSSTRGDEHHMWSPSLMVDAVSCGHLIGASCSRIGHSRGAQAERRMSQ